MLGIIYEFQETSLHSESVLRARRKEKIVLKPTKFSKLKIKSKTKQQTNASDTDVSFTLNDTDVSFKLNDDTDASFKLNDAASSFMLNDTDDSFKLNDTKDNASSTGIEDNFLIKQNVDYTKIQLKLSFDNEVSDSIFRDYWTAEEKGNLTFFQHKIVDVFFSS